MADLRLHNFAKTWVPWGSISLINRVDSPQSASSITSADLNGDGQPDITTGNGLTGNISVMQNNSGGGQISLLFQGCQLSKNGQF